MLTTITTQANPITTQANPQCYYPYIILYININITIYIYIYIYIYENVLNIQSILFKNHIYVYLF